MGLTPWDKLPEQMRNDEVRRYYELLEHKGWTFFWKRTMDIVLSFLAIIVISPILLLCAAVIKLTSRGPVFFKQERVGKDMKPFHILKFRTMVDKAESLGVQLTTGDDARVTKVGKVLRNLNFDEVPQLFNVLFGDMTIIGTRPEVPRYVQRYTPVMFATLLTRPGMLSLASLKYRHENDLLTGSEDPERTYFETILPDKMKYNLEYYEHFTYWNDIKLIGKSIACAFHQ